MRASSALSAALAAWREALGAAHVEDAPEALRQVETATFATDHRIPCVLRPASREEVQACLRIAQRHQIPLYPISGGKNWGYGSRVPCVDQCAVLDLRRMAQIVDFDEELAYITVEPGVTFAQVAGFLRQQGSSLMLNTTGSAPDSSVLGNAIERGHGLGPYCDRFAHVSGLEVVLANGEWLRTGFGRYHGLTDSGAKVPGYAQLYRWGVGPFLDGLFSQSNLGVVTQLTTHLAPLPSTFRLCTFALDRDHLSAAIDALRPLQHRGILRGPVMLWNHFKCYAAQQRYPWAEAAGQTPLPPELLGAFCDVHGGLGWLGWIGLYCASPAHADAEQALLLEALSPHASQLYVTDRAASTTFKGDPAHAPPPSDYRHTTHLGAQTGGSIVTTYWRKPQDEAFPEPLDPDRDRCGIAWVTPTVPLRGRDVHAATQAIEARIIAGGFEPNVSLFSMNSRQLDIAAGILYDRDSPGEDERAMRCHHELVEELAAMGYLPHRLGIQSMGLLPPICDDSAAFFSRLKQALDPHQILAPGRYDWGQKPS